MPMVSFSFWGVTRHALENRVRPLPADRRR
jgi:hypothetical protein